MDNRNQMGKIKGGVIFPIAPNLSEMSDAYVNNFPVALPPADSDMINQVFMFSYALNVTIFI